MADLTKLIDSVASLQDSFKESFEVFKLFLLDLQIVLLSVGFIILFLLFILLVIGVLSSPAFVINLYKKQETTLKDFFKNNKVKRDWLGRS